MPQGWLVSYSPQPDYWKIQDGTTRLDVSYNPHPCAMDGGQTSGELNYGTREVHAYSRLELFKKVWVCYRSQYAAPRQKVQHGWFTAFPWLAQHAGAPRDMYVELTTIDYDQLLNKHRPRLQHDDGETYPAQDARLMIDWVHNRLDRSDQIAPIAAHGSPNGVPELEDERLGEQYAPHYNAGASKPEDHLVEDGGTLQAAVD